MKTLAQWLEWIERTHTSEIELGLDRATEVASRMGLHPIDGNGLSPLQDGGSSASRNIADHIVTVAGTNGKGTTVAVLEQILCDAGRSVGVYTSPHFHRYNERFRINLIEVDDQRVIEALEAVEAAREDTALTYFEFSTLAALQLFSEQQLDVVILEVGLGGRLDAVNAVPADTVVITRIDLDHQSWLGDTRELIGAEKAGVLRDEINLVCSDREATDSIRLAAEAHRALAQYLGIDFDIVADSVGQSRATAVEENLGEAMIWQSVQGASLNLPACHLHPDNIAAALAVAELLKLPLEEPAVAESLSKVQLPGRLQTVDLGGLAVLLDVAHNPAAVEHLRSVIRQKPRRRCSAVFAVMANKDWSAMVDIINDVIDDWFLAELPTNQRAERAVNVAEYLQSDQDDLAVSIHADPGLALAAAIDSVQSGRSGSALTAESHQADAQILVFGSFFTVAPALDYLRSLPAPEFTPQSER